MPFSDVARSISCGFECFGDGNLFKLHPQCVRGTQKLFVFTADVVCGIFFVLGYIAALEPRSDPVGHAETCRVASCHHCRPCRRADRTSGVAVGEPDALRSEPVNIRGFVKLAPIAAGIHPTQIIDENQNEIEILSRLWLGETCMHRDSQRGRSQPNGLQETATRVILFAHHHFSFIITIVWLMSGAVAGKVPS